MDDDLKKQLAIQAFYANQGQLAGHLSGMALGNLAGISQETEQLRAELAAAKGLLLEAERAICPHCGKKVT